MLDLSARHTTHLRQIGLAKSWQGSLQNGYLSGRQHVGAVADGSTHMHVAPSAATHAPQLLMAGGVLAQPPLVGISSVSQHYTADNLSNMGHDDLEYVLPSCCRARVYACQKTCTACHWQAEEPAAPGRSQTGCPCVCLSASGITAVGLPAMPLGLSIALAARKCQYTRVT